jgi:GNAT superfamily N-acetyltransferase
MDSVRIRRLTGDDWELLREIRFAALTDAPLAFGSTYERERTYDEAKWREWLRNAAVFIAERDGQAIGIAAGMQFDDADRRALLSMWVRPDARGGGVGDRLVRTVIAWTRDEGAHALDLGVAEGNDPARRLYERHGFVPTGVRTPLPHTVSVIEIDMSLALTHEDARSSGA